MHGLPLSRNAREKRMAYMESVVFDALIIGGGITGAGVAREASLAGLKVALLEAKDFASGTSSRSTKLFHGGLRYLERAEFLLVREGGREREGMQRLAPHLVHPLPFLLPIYRNMKYGKFAMGTAVWLYDKLAQVDPGEQRVVLSEEEVLRLEPQINPEGLTGGVLYHEYLTDDARCVVTVLRAAEELGAVSLNYAPVAGLLYEDGRVCGARTQDLESGRSIEVRAKVVINATGPWIEDVMQMDRGKTAAKGQNQAGGAKDADRDGAAGSKILHSRGVHIAFSRTRLPVGHAFAIQTPDGRLLFIIPRDDRTYVGTTDEPYQGNLYHPDILERDVEYLLDLVNGVFPGLRVEPSDIIGQWSGVRPLVYEPGKASKDVSRRDQIWVSPSGLVTIAGGKLTAWRKMAEEVMDTVYEHAALADRLGGISAWMAERAKTLSPVAPLPGGLSIPPKGMEDWVKEESARLYALAGVSAEDGAMLARRYGDEAERVALYSGSAEACRIDPAVPLLRGELRYLVEREMAVHLADVVVRRTGLGWFGGDDAVRSLAQIADEMAALCGWSAQETQAEIEDCWRESYWLDRNLYKSEAFST
ncbi:MAG: glycerol-3-phosphate dehydrogenase/oxidase [Bacilli bacterium]